MFPGAFRILHRLVALQNEEPARRGGLDAKEDADKPKRFQASKDARLASAGRHLMTSAMFSSPRLLSSSSNADTRHG